MTQKPNSVWTDRMRLHEIRRFYISPHPALLAQFNPVASFKTADGGKVAWISLLLWRKPLLRLKKCNSKWQCTNCTEYLEIPLFLYLFNIWCKPWGQKDTGSVSIKMNLSLHFHNAVVFAIVVVLVTLNRISV